MVCQSLGFAFSYLYMLWASLCCTEWYSFVFQVALSQFLGMGSSRIIPSFGRLVGCIIILISACCTMYIGPEKEIEWQSWLFPFFFFLASTTHGVTTWFFNFILPISNNHLFPMLQGFFSSAWVQWMPVCAIMNLPSTNYLKCEILPELPFLEV